MRLIRSHRETLRPQGGAARRRSTRMRRVIAPAVVLLLAIGIAGCGNDPNSIAAQAQAGNDKGYRAGDGSVEQLAVSQRKKPVKLAGKTVEGKPWSLKADAEGKIVVLNVWGAWCPPCQAEMPELEKAWKTFNKKDLPVVMIGLDQRDSPQKAAATLKKWGVSYPSLRDDNGKSLLGLQGKVVTTPTTLVLDKQHRIAGRVSGQTTASTLTGMVQDVLQGGGDSAG